MSKPDPSLSDFDSRIPEDLKKLAIFLDSQFEGPFGFRFGWDGLIGLIPGIGAILPAVVSLYIVVRAIMLRVSFVTVLHMIVNVLIDTVLSMIPVFGQLADFFWKSNLKNLELMDRYFTAPASTVRNSALYLILLSSGFVSVIIFLVWSAVKIGIWLVHLF